MVLVENDFPLVADDSGDEIADRKYFAVIVLISCLESSRLHLNPLAYDAFIATSRSQFHGLFLYLLI